MDDLNNLSAPGVYTQPESSKVVTPELSGYGVSRDVGQYRLYTHTDTKGVVTNWQRELPDGEWRKVASL